MQNWPYRPNFAVDGQYSVGRAMFLLSLADWGDWGGAVLVGMGPAKDRDPLPGL